MAPPIAVVTGACSGIGLALTKYLLERKWNVAMADVNPPKEDLAGTTYIKADIGSWDQQAAMFTQAYEWQGRIDFVALNAGVDDRDDIFHSISGDPSKPPKQPNMLCFDVNLIGTYYGLKLAAHYLSLDGTAAGKPKKGGKIVVTASAAGIYPAPNIPQYVSAKHGLVGLVRSVGPLAAQDYNITINALCPALVSTGFAPPGLLEKFTPEQFTPMSTMMRCFSEMASFDQIADEDWVEKGPSGETVEGNLEQLIWHKPPPRPEGASYRNEEGESIWASAYVERNRKFAEEDWMSLKQQ